MSEEITKEIKNIDKQFSEIVVNGDTFESSNFEPKTLIKRTLSTTGNQAPSSNQQSQPSQQNQTVGESVQKINLNNTLHDIEDPNAQEAVDTLQSNVTTIQSNVNTLQSNVNTLQSNVDGIQELIPAQASETNKLADKNFVNSTVGTNTANYISNNGQPFTSVAQLEAYSGTVTNNDYAFVTGTDEDGNVFFDRYKATVTENPHTVSWGKEYRLNNSSFTAQQWETINSGITALLVQKLENVEAGAEVNTIESISVNGSHVNPDANRNVNLQVASASDLARKLDKSGGTMTGTLNLIGDHYWESNHTPALDAKNSGIVGLNNLVFNDVTDTGVESVIFPKETAEQYTGFFIDKNGNPKIADITKPVGGTATVTGTRSIGSNDGFFMDDFHYLNFDDAIGNLTKGEVYISFDVCSLVRGGSTVTPTSLVKKATVGICVILARIATVTSVTGTTSNKNYNTIDFYVPSTSMLTSINVNFKPSSKAVKVSNLSIYYDIGSAPTSGSGFLDISKVRLIEGSNPPKTTLQTYTLLSPSNIW